MKLLALDISTTATGYALTGKAGKRPVYGVFNPAKGLDRTERIADQVEQILRMVALCGVDRIVAEAVSVGSFKRKDGSKGAGSLTSATALAEAHGALKHELLKTGRRMETLNLSKARARLEIRQALGIKGNPKKEDCQRWLALNGYPTKNGDEADALVVWMATMKGE